jgi:hypothetical protein
MLAPVLVFADASPIPALVLIVLGFAVGVTGHVVGHKGAIATGIGLIFVGSLLLPLVFYLSSR